MYHEFPVDYMIGSNVSLNADPPTEDDIISQITTMFVQKTNFNLPCEYGVIIEPEIDIGTFEFENEEKAMQSGYDATQIYLDSILPNISKRVKVSELNEQRKQFRSKISPLLIDSINVSSYKNFNVSFVEDNFQKDSIEEPIDFETFKKRYFKTYATPQIRYLYPTLSKSSDTTYQLSLD